MQKTGSPWYRKGKDSWYVWHAGRQVFLARGKGNKAEAFARFSELLNDPTADPKAARFTVADLVQQFEKSATERVTHGTLTADRCILSQFVAVFGTRAPADLTPPQVTEWAHRGKWSAATRRYPLMVVCTVYSWAEKLGKVLPNPLKGMKKPPAKSRGAEVLIDDDLHERPVWRHGTFRGTPGAGC